MRKPVFMVAVVVAGTILLCAVLANFYLISPPRLVVTFGGTPASNVPLILPLGSGRPYQLDEDGSIKSPTPGTQSAILVPRPDGGAVSVRFPKHGRKTVDFRDQVQTVTVVQYFGFVHKQSQLFALTKEQVAEIESGHKSLADIEEQIRRPE